MGIPRTRVLAIAAAIVFLLANFALFRFVGEAEAYPQRRTLAEFPTQVGEWSCPRRIFMEEDTLRISDVDDYLLCNYERPRHGGGEEGSARAPALEVVNLYLGYHARQMRAGGTGRGDDEGAIHPPKHCLPGSGWDIVEAGEVEVVAEGLPGGRASVNRFIIAKGNDRQVVYYWYHSRGRVIASDWQKIVYLAIDRVWKQRTDGSLVRFTAPVFGGDNDAADASVRAAMAAIVPRLPDFLPE